MQDIVGAQTVMKGQATEASGVVARGNKLTIRLTHAARDFPARTAFYAFCAVPIDLPVSAEGVGAPLSGGGPYTIAAFVPGQTLVMKRNPFYSGLRPSQRAPGRIARFTPMRDGCRRPRPPALPRPGSGRRPRPSTTSASGRKFIHHRARRVGELGGYQVVQCRLSLATITVAAPKRPSSRAPRRPRAGCRDPFGGWRSGGSLP